MVHQSPLPPLALLRRKQVEALTGYSRSTIYDRITKGLWPQPVGLGGCAVGWPAGEVYALNAARIAGGSDTVIRALVKKLVSARATVEEHAAAEVSDAGN
jgi:prophage regulatory protein